MLIVRLCLGALLVGAAPALAADISAVSAVDSVVVYPQGATVVRRADVALPAGASVVVIDTLPAGIETDSIKVEGAGSQPFAIASVETRYVPADEANDPGRERLLALIQDLEDRIAAVDDRVGALEGRREFLQRLIDATPDGFGEGLAQTVGGIDQWVKAATTIGDGLGEVAEGIRAAHIEQRGLNETLDKRRAELAALPAARDRIAVRIAVAAEGPATGVLSISYRSPAAQWIPAYDALLATGENGGKPTLTIVRRAEVVQATGEDWTDVAMTLSTTRAAGGTAVPYLPTNLVSIFDGYDYAYPEAEAAMTAAPRPLPAVPALDALGVLGGTPEEAKYIEAAANFGDFRAEYVVPGRVSVASGEGARGMQIATEQVATRLEVRAVPMLSDLAYLHAAFVPAEGAPLLPGRVALFRDGTFVGNGELPMGRAGRELNLGFGIDDRVRVTRVALERETGEYGILLSSRKTDTQRFKITVDNLHSQPIAITIYDRTPYAEDESVTIQRLRDTTEPTVANVDDRRGVLAWTYTYDPGETREILNGFEVSWPADKEVVSLDS
jgi:uncharacterized protein (TIGR02231 family)